jgi:hydroxypyruvate reductase
MHNPRHRLLEIFQAALDNVNGRRRVADQLSKNPLPGNVYTIAVGKASVAMTRGALDALGSNVVDGFVVTKDEYDTALPNVHVFVGAHPVPGIRSFDAGRALFEFIARIPESALVLVLLSGGASALVEVPPPDVSPEAIANIHRWLLASGLDIHAMNRIRKRLSCLKGGRLAKRLSPRRVLGLVLSDVPGNNPASIGSGPLTAETDPTQIPMAGDLPDFLRTALQKSEPFPNADDACFGRIKLSIIGNIESAMQAAGDAAARLGFKAKLHERLIEGDALETGRRLAAELLASSPNTLHVWGGETTVKLPALAGRGGRNQTLALSAAVGLAGSTNVWLLAAGTDGSDGPTDDAGAVVDGQTLERGKLHDFDANRSLNAADAGSFLEASGDLIQTGPTGTNVMDLILGLRLE